MDLDYRENVIVTTPRSFQALQEETSKDVASQYKPYQWSILNKCYVNLAALTKHQTYAIKAKFMDSDYRENVIVTTPRSFQALQESKECQSIFEHTGFDKFFRLTPCQVDPKRCVELLSSLQEDGTC